jgi:hypothetical protein
MLRQTVRRRNESDGRVPDCQVFECSDVGHASRRAPCVPPWESPKRCVFPRARRSGRQFPPTRAWQSMSALANPIPDPRSLVSVSAPDTIPVPSDRRTHRRDPG